MYGCVAKHECGDVSSSSCTPPPLGYTCSSDGFKTGTLLETRYTEQGLSDVQTTECVSTVMYDVCQPVWVDVPESTSEQCDCSR